MNRLVTITMALLLSGCAVNGHWSSRDTALEISYQIVNALDAASTARIEDTPDWTPVDGTNYIWRLEEGVPLTRAILGPRPSKSETYLYFATLGVSHWLIANSSLSPGAKCSFSVRSNPKDRHVSGAISTMKVLPSSE